MEEEVLGALLVINVHRKNASDGRAMRVVELETNYL